MTRSTRAGEASTNNASYQTDLRLAVSTDGGLTFNRLFDGPIVDRTRFEPYSCLSPFVLEDEGTWKLWYAATTGFVSVNGRQEPQYPIRYADSADGIEWRRAPAACIGYRFDGEANGRPWVVKENGQYRMWSCYRSIIDDRTDTSKSYRIGYTESENGLDSTRLDHLAGIGCSDPLRTGFSRIGCAGYRCRPHRDDPSRRSSVAVG